MGIKYFQHLLICLFLPACGLATDYYISNSGNDNNNGTTPATAWQTINKLNGSFSIIQPGDNIFFKRGEKFVGTIRVTISGRQGQPISFGAYGNGSDPVISGFTNIKGWVKKEKNTWQAAAPFLQSNLNMVAMDDVPQQIGRYPNANEPGVKVFATRNAPHLFEIGFLVGDCIGNSHRVFERDRHAVPPKRIDGSRRVTKPNRPFGRPPPEHLVCGRHHKDRADYLCSFHSLKFGAFKIALEERLPIGSCVFKLLC